MIGLTPMIGTNDDKSVFTPSDPDWAYSHVFVQFMTAFQPQSVMPQAVAVPI